MAGRSEIADLGVARRSEALVTYKSTLRFGFCLARLDLDDLRTSWSGVAPMQGADDGDSEGTQGCASLTLGCGVEALSGPSF